jgi:hypothetical protein
LNAVSTPTPKSGAFNVRKLQPKRSKARLTRGRLSFQTAEERMVYDELNRQRQGLNPYDSFAVATLVPANVPGHTFELDLVVTSRGRSAVIEVDGAVHSGRWGHDRSRDCLLEDAGYLFVQRIDARDVHDPGALREFVVRFLFRLRERAAG